jgi:ribosomal protein S18 acetylase RimI-like enzyme
VKGSSGTVALRRGGPADRGFVLDLGRRTTLDSMSALRTAPPVMLQSSFEQLIDFAFERQYVLLIAERELDGPVGFLLMLDDLPDEVTALPQGFIAYMAVEPDARRHGIGEQLLAAAEDAARVRGLPYMALMVTEDNGAARELYAQAGYVTERRLLCKPL